MLISRMAQAVRRYLEELEEKEVAGVSAPLDKLSPHLSAQEIEKHIAYMCTAVLDLIEHGHKLDKAYRWVGFIQGVLWAQGKYSIKDLKSHFESEEEPGYHLVTIERGELGEFSKIREEFEELADAQSQGSKILSLVELSDLMGAIHAFLENHFPSINLEDLIDFSEITARAFESGKREASND